MKRCTVCKSEKQLSEFSGNKNRPGWRHSNCKKCKATAAVAYYVENKDRILAAQKGRNQKYYRRHDIKKLYGLSESDYTGMLVVQQNRCAICKGDNGGQTLAIDHCHATGRVRGLLCHKCNRGIGQMQDSPELLRTAAEYLVARR